MPFRRIFKRYRTLLHHYRERLRFRILENPSLTYHDINGKVLKAFKNHLTFLTNPINDIVLQNAHYYLKNYRTAFKYPEKTFKDVEYFTLFVNADRSGHSLVGSLLDAHPNIIISHEIRAMSLLKPHHYELSKVYSRILANSVKKSGKKGRYQTSYDYNVAYEYAGKYTTLKVIGDKKGMGTAQYIFNYPEVFKKLHDILGNKLKIICVFRNPYDNIAAMSIRRKMSMKKCIRTFFQVANLINRIKTWIPEEQILIVRQENLIDNLRTELTRIIKFYGLEVPEDYIEACQKRVFKQPHSRRKNFDWKENDKATIKKLINLKKFQEFFAGYEF